MRFSIERAVNQAPCTVQGEFQWQPPRRFEARQTIGYGEFYSITELDRSYNFVKAPLARNVLRGISKSSGARLPAIAMNAAEIIPPDLEDDVKRALDEDLGSGDITASLVAAEHMADAKVICREPAVLCGAPWFNEVFRAIDDSVEIDWRFSEGDAMAEGATACLLHGTARSLLSGERTALNFLQTLSGTATETRRHVERIADLSTRILDTRKTLPGLRNAQKYAVRVGGGHNHRHGLHDGVLIKENHRFAAGPPAEQLRRLRQDLPAGFLVEVEITEASQLEDAIASGASRIMLDNFGIDQIAAAVRLAAGRVELEASGNFGIDSIREVAETGVDYVSIGALTKNVSAIDYSMLFVD